MAYKDNNVNNNDNKNVTKYNIKDVKELISNKIAAVKMNTEDDSKDAIKDRCLDAFLEAQEELGFELGARETTAMVLGFLNAEIASYNENIKKGGTKMRGYEFLPPDILAKIVVRYEPIERISINGKKTSDDSTIIGVYVADGDMVGTYDLNESAINGSIAKYSSLENSKQVAEVRAKIFDLMKDKVSFLDSNPHKVAVQNGIFDWDTKELEPFSHEYVTLNKMNVICDLDMEEPQIIMPDGEVWTPREWLKSLSDDEDVRQLMLDMLTAAVFSGCKWDKIFLLYSSLGNNGKGTFLVLIENMLGEQNCAHIALEEYSQSELMLEAMGKKAIISHESDVGKFITSAKDLKSTGTQDSITCKRKYKSVITFKPTSFAAHAINDLPRFKDKSGGLNRRFAIVPFDKCFNGVEREYIREDYLKRPEVLSYFFKMAVENRKPNFKHDLPEASLALLDEFKEVNNPLYVFYKECVCEYEAWDMYPFQFIFAHYKAWFAKNYDSGTNLGRTTFIRDLTQIVLSDEDSPFTVVSNKENKWIPAELDGAMDGVEEAIIEYGLQDYIAKSYHGTDPEKITNFKRPKKCRSYLLRKKANTTTKQTTEQE